MKFVEAERAYRRAIDLDSDPRVDLLQLATLYTYGPAGIRYGASAHLDQALEAYRQVGLDSIARAGAMNDYAAALLFARKYDDIRQLFLYPQAETQLPLLSSLPGSYRKRRRPSTGGPVSVSRRQ
jgi:tetratricopeptide (TPR) repeat protein